MQILRAMIILEGVGGIKIQFILAIPPYNMKNVGLHCQCLANEL
jgi:hypothetical protein